MNPEAAIGRNSCKPEVRFQAFLRLSQISFIWPQTRTQALRALLWSVWFLTQKMQRVDVAYRTLGMV